MSVTQLSPTFEISIPSEICRALLWEAGQRLALIHKDNALLLMAVPTLEDLRGIARGAKDKTVRERDDELYHDR